MNFKKIALTALLITSFSAPAFCETAELTTAEKAIEEVKRLAFSGNAKAQFELGEMYEQGRGGMKRDLAYALSWYEEAARNGLKMATYRLKMMTSDRTPASN